MKRVDFLNKLLKCSSEESKIRELFNEIKDFDIEESDDESVKDFISRIEESKITDFGDKLYILSHVCVDEKNAAEKYGGKDYANKSNSLLTKVKGIMTIYDQVLNPCDGDKKNQTNSPRNIGSGEHGDINRALNEINSLKTQINSTKDSFEDRSISILTNNISILGIFVAIAFAGFGVMSIFPEIDISYAVISRINFIKVTFFLMLTTLMVYNLLLLLAYFIFKLTQAFGVKQENKSSFLGSVNLTPFYWIDGMLVLFTLALFVVSLCNIQ